MNSLWVAVALTCMRKDWFGYAVFLGMGVVTYPSFSITLVLLCLAVLTIVAAVRIALTYLHVRSKLNEVAVDQRVSDTSGVAKFCDAHIRGVFG